MLLALREDEASRVDPRCLPSVGDARAPARTVADLEQRSRDAFRFDPALDALSPATLRGAFALACRPWARLPSPYAPRSGEMESVRFSESDAAYRLLQTDLRRTGTFLERPILARLERTTLLRPCTLRVCPRLPRLSLERRGAREPISLEMSGQRATSDPSPLATRRLQARREVRVWKAAALRRAACGQRYDLPGGCATDELKRRQWTAWAEPPGVKDLPSPRMRRRMARWLKAPLLRSCSSTPWSPARLGRRAGDSLRLRVSRPRLALTRLPAKGDVLARARMLSTVWDPAHDDYSPRYPPAVGFRPRRPPLSRMGIAVRRRALLQPLRTEAPDPDEASARSGSVRSA